MLLKHFFIEKIAHSSYMLAGQDICAVIDPQRDVDIYINEARRLGVDITHVLQTHLHADFISGHMDLAKRTGAMIYAPKSANCTFKHTALSEGDVIKIEDMHLSVMETPGHTPEHICYVVKDTTRGDSPLGVFTGDTLFVGDVGRPDLFPDMAMDLASKLYHSLHEKLLTLPDYCEVYPAHGAGSLCGRAMGAKFRTTIGFERRYNNALQLPKEDFIRSLTEDMPPAPDHFSRCSDINRQGPALISGLPILIEMDPLIFKNEMEKPDTILLDVRSYDAFSGHHIPGSWHIDFKGNFPTFCGWVLPVDKNILLIAQDYHSALNAIESARRVGVDRIIGYLDGGITSWVTLGLPTESVHLISAEDLHAHLDGPRNLVLIDVRTPKEFEDSHIKGAFNIPAPDLRQRYRELDPEKPTVLICSSGNRSSLAGSILMQHGFKEVFNVAGGMTGYSAAGYTKKCMVCENPHGSRYFSSYLKTNKHFKS